MKKKQVLDSQCPCCSAPLFYNTKDNRFKCEYCDSVFTLEDLKNIEDVNFEEKILKKKYIYHIDVPIVELKL